MNRIRILHIVAGMDVGHTFGGAERSGLELARALDPSAFEVTVCSFWRCDTPVEAAWQSELEAAGIPVLYATHSGARRNSSDFWAGARRVVDWARAHPVHIIHAHHEGGALAALLAKARGGTRAALRTAYVPLDEEWGNGVAAAVFRAVCSQVLFPALLQAEVNVSPDHRRRLAQRPFAKRDPQLIYNTRRLMIHAPALPTTPLIGSVGRLTSQKGHIDLVNAMPHICAALPEARAVIAGEGELRPMLQQRAEALGVAGHIQLLGQRDDIDALLRQMTLFVMPSRWEGVPLALLEAVAAGVPVVAADIPGFREFIVHGQNGWLVPPGDAPALAQAVIGVLTEPQHALACARAAQTSILPKFSIEAIAGQYQTLYRSLVHA